MTWSRLCFIWVLLWLAPQYAGDWYDEAYGVYQALISAVLLLCVWFLPNRQQWQYLSLMVILCLQVGLVGLWQLGWDHPELVEGTPVYVSSEFYDVAALTVGNGLEVFLLFFIGGIRTAIHEYANHSSNSGDDARRYG